MMNCEPVSLIRSFLFFILVFVHINASFLGQIATDGSVGPSQSLQGPEYTIGQELGKLAGNNLFHSFREFNINTNESATFTGEASIERVISRVTGGNISNIDGLLMSGIPNADFFLINPAGVMFGPNAGIDIKGSFSVSTADYLRFGDDNQFFSQPLENDVLSAEAPTAYGFLGADIGKINFDRTQVVAQEGESLSVIAGDIDAVRTRLQTSGGDITVLSVGSAGEATLETLETGSTTVNVDGFTDLGNVTLINGSPIIANNGGNVDIHGEDLSLKNASISSNAFNGLDGGDIEIFLTGTLDIGDGSNLSSTISNKGKAGNIIIASDRVLLNGLGASALTGIFTDSKETTAISTDVNVSLDIRHTSDSDLTVFLVSPSETSVLLFQNVGVGEENFIGTVLDDDAERPIGLDPGPFSGRFQPAGTLSDIDGEDAEGIWRLEVKDNFSLGEGSLDEWSLTFGEAEFLSTDVPKEIKDFSKTVSTVDVDFSEEDGDGGDIMITANTLSVSGGQIVAASSSAGQGGNIAINAETIMLDGDPTAGFTGITALTRKAINGGTGGNITIETNAMEISDRAEIRTTSKGSGDAGNINITAEKAIVIDGDGPNTFTGISAQTEAVLDGGKGGNIHIDTNNLTLRNGADISSSTIGSGDSGKIFISAMSILLDGQELDPFTGIFSQTMHGNPEDMFIITENLDIKGGNAGDISIITENLDIIDRAEISTTSFGSGDGGDIFIMAKSISLDGDPFNDSTGIAAQTQSKDGGGKGGNITIDTHTLQVLERSEITSGTIGDGVGGRVFINAESIILNGLDADEFTGISAQSLAEGNAGNGGEIVIKTVSLEVLGSAEISASTFGNGRSGDIGINAESITLNGIDSNRFTGIAGGSNLELGEGSGGNITIEMKDLKILHGAGIDASTFGNGDGGNITISGESITLDGSLGFAEIGARTLSSFGRGKGGNISIHTEDLQVRNQGSISASSANSGSGGNIEIHSKNIALADDSIIQSFGDGSGDAGNIVLEVGSIMRILNSTVTTLATQSNGGNLSITAGKMINLDDTSSVTSLANLDGGNIQLNAPILRLSESDISASAGNNGGNLGINNTVTVLDGTSILANALLGNGGKITITTKGLLENHDKTNIIDASSELGLSGTIEIRTPDIDLTAGLMPLAEDFLEVDSLSFAKCSTRYERGEINTFHVVEREGISVAPDDFLPNFLPLLGEDNE